MLKKPSKLWLYICLFGSLILTCLGLIFTGYSYQSANDEAIQLAKMQLTKVNNCVSDLLTLEINHTIHEFDNYASEVYSNNIHIPKQLNIDNNLKQLIDENKSAFSAIYLFQSNGTFQDGYQLDSQQHLVKTAEPSIVQRDILFEQAFEKELQNGKAYFDKKRHASYLNIYYYLKNEQKQLIGVIILQIQLEKLFMHKIRTNDDLQGYSMVKNMNMEIVMHPVPEQVGLTIVEARQEKFPTLDYSDLKHLKSEQQNKESGSMVYNSYWWTKKDYKQVKKVTVFKRIKIGKEIWIVASNTDLQRQTNLFSKDLLTVLGLLAIILAISILAFLNLRAYMRRNFAYNEHQRIIAQYEMEQQKNELEKTILRESKLETIGLLTTSIVHDMNNFLTPLIGNLELMMENYHDNPEIIEELNEIHLAAKRGQNLSKQVLNFSKTQNTEIHLININKAVKDATDTISLLAPKGIQIFFNDSHEIFQILLSKEELQVILYNLITNSIQAMKNHGKIFISIKKAQNELLAEFRQHSYIYKNKQFVAISVKDTGPGIPEDFREKIFEPFFTTKYEKGGTGLGLYIVQSLVNKNDWLLTFTSNENGSQFTIGIPIE